MRLETHIKELENAVRKTRRPTSAPIPDDPIEWAESMSIELEAFQKQVLTLVHESDTENKALRLIILASRQSGKDFCCALAAAFHALSVPNATVVCLSKSLRQSSLLFRAIMRFYRLSGRPIPALSESALSLRLENGSSIYAIPGSSPETVRGFSSVSLLLVSEAVYISSALFKSVVPFCTRIKSSKIVLLTTPRGKGSWLYRLWEDDPNWVKIKVKAEDISHFSKETLEEARRLLGPEWYRMEYEAEWGESEFGLFRAESIERAIRDDIEPLDLDDFADFDADSSDEFELDLLEGEQ